MDEEISFNCPHCNANLTVSVKQAGMGGPCPSCGYSIVAPDAPISARHREERRIPPLQHNAGTGGRGRPAPIEGGASLQSGKISSLSLGGKNYRKMVSPTATLKEEYIEKRELKRNGKILVWTIVVAFIAVGAMWWVMRLQI